MKLPTRNSLSPEQERIYTEAPLNGCTVILGPPGTGKTVLGVYRAQLFQKQKLAFRFIMFNQVLRQFTLQSLDDKGIQDSTKTWHSWVYSWWRQANRGRGLPEIRRWTPDFIKALAHLDDVKAPKQLDWSNLIIDEGQDFPRDFYLLLSCVMSDPKFHRLAAPSLTVLADQNQRLDPSKNSTVAQIIDALGVPSDSVYLLRKNFRNTLQIAQLARIFHTSGLEDLPELPERSGPKPALVKFGKFNDEVEQILRYARNNDDLEIGVFLPDLEVMERFFKALEAGCATAAIRLQCYSSERKDILPVFDSQGSVTLLCGNSVKGVEFDSVFVPQLTGYRTDGVHVDFLKMKFYVLTTRARKFLQFSYSDASTAPAVLGLFADAGPDVLDRR